MKNMECPYCGAHNSETADFCNLCLKKFKSNKKQKKPKKQARKVVVSEPVKKTKQKKNYLILIAPAAIASVGAFVLTLLVPIGKPLLISNNPNLFISLMALAGGWAVSAKFESFELKRMLTGFMIGIAAVFSGYIITFLVWLMLMKTSIMTFIRISFRVEMVVIPLVLAVGIAIFDQVEDLRLKRFSKVLGITLIGSIIAILVSYFFTAVNMIVFSGLFCWLSISAAELFIPEKIFS